MVATAGLASTAAGARVTAALAPVVPAALAHALPALDFLSPLAAPVEAEATADLGPQLTLRAAKVRVEVGAGTLQTGAAPVPVVTARLVATVTPDDLQLASATLALRPHDGGIISTLTASGNMHRAAGRTDAALSFALDQAAAADLPALWPPGIAPGARAWVTQNIMVGLARNGRLQIGFSTTAGLSAIALTQASGSIEGHDLTMTRQPFAAAGLGGAQMLTGLLDLQAALAMQGNDSGFVALDADLTPAALVVPLLAWRKPPGAKASLKAKLQIRNGELTDIDGISVEGDGLAVQGSAQCTHERISLVRLDRLGVGHSEGKGTIRIPVAPQTGPIAVDLAGTVLDLSGRFAHPVTTPSSPAAKPAAPHPWTLKARFDRVVMAGGRQLARVSLQVENDRTAIRRLQIEGATGTGARFALRIAPAGRQARLMASAGDAGELLRAFDITDAVQGGSLAIDGTYAGADRSLHGTVELLNIRVNRAMALGKLLQAMTLYGVWDAMRGPGVAFTHLIAPFTLYGHTLRLANARAFSPSLGLTASGRIDITTGYANLQGTIVPAYFFNNLLGKLPLVGRFLSPERGGGVFAADYELRGGLNDPDVTVHPLSALTPDFLRGLFGNLF